MRCSATSWTNKEVVMRTSTGLAAMGIVLAASGVAAAQEAQELYEENTSPMFGRGLAVMGGIGVETFSSSTASGTGRNRG